MLELSRYVPTLFQEFLYHYNEQYTINNSWYSINTSLLSTFHTDMYQSKICIYIIAFISGAEIYSTGILPIVDRYHLFLLSAQSIVNSVRQHLIKNHIVIPNL